MREGTGPYLNILERKLSRENLDKLLAIDNPALHEFVAKYVEHCNPDDVFVSMGTDEELKFIREEAIRAGEERRLAIEGHTIHFDGYYDQARDRKNTRLLLPKGVDLGLGALAAGESLGQLEREAGLREIHALLKDIMRGHRLFVLFFCLGPLNSEFSIPCLQLTDSPYVAHSENLLYRQGYSEFRRLGRKARFFKFVHSEGELVNGVSKNIDKRRIYVDLTDETVYSVNTQYGGNTIGLKKLAMRLAIKRASEEGWLTEHMFIMGVHGPNGRLTYFTGAFPSLCGKTSTSMMRGEKIVGDDIAYLRIRQGRTRAVNVECGMFGIIQGVNSKDDPILWKALHSPVEIIFSNVLMLDDGSVYWIGHDGEVPKRGINHSGEWYPGKRDAEGNEIPPSHKNARLTLNMKLLENLDPRIEDP
ncbi:MAG: phosphoenolpyruvate carboxykinase domain-containing protein, partial [Candidatus Hadarchaeum sp.]